MVPPTLPFNRSRYLSGIIQSILKISLSFSQLRIVTTYAEAAFKERPLHVINNTGNYVRITPNLLIFGRNLRMLSHDMLDIKLNDPKFRTYKNLIIKLKNKLGNIKISYMISSILILIKSKVKSKSLVLPKLTNSFN